MSPEGISKGPTPAHATKCASVANRLTIPVWVRILPAAIGPIPGMLVSVDCAFATRAVISRVTVVIHLYSRLI